MTPLRPLALLSAGGLLGAALALAYFQGVPVQEGPPSGSSPAQASVPVVGASAPDFTLTTAEGENVRLSDLRGQIVVLNFWATWCEPCRDEMPLLNSRYERHRERGFVVLGVNFDESAAEVQAYAEDLQISFPLLLDPGAVVQRMYRVRGYPSTFVVDRAGRLVAEYIGLIREAQLDEELAQLGLAP